MRYPIVSSSPYLHNTNSLKRLKASLPADFRRIILSIHLIQQHQSWNQYFIDDNISHTHWLNRLLFSKSFSSFSNFFILSGLKVPTLMRFLCCLTQFSISCSSILCRERLRVGALDLVACHWKDARTCSGIGFR